MKSARRSVSWIYTLLILLRNLGSLFIPVLLGSQRRNKKDPTDILLMRHIWQVSWQYPQTTHIPQTKTHKGNGRFSNLGSLTVTSFLDSYQINWLHFLWVIIIKLLNLTLFTVLLIPASPTSVWQHQKMVRAKSMSARKPRTAQHLNQPTS